VSLGAGLTTRGRAGLAVVAAALAVLLGAGRAEAHAVGLSTGDYRVDRDGRSLEVEITVARTEAAGIEGLDADRDGTVTEAEVDAGRGLLARTLLGGIRAGGSACAPTSSSAAPTEQDGLRIRGHLACGGAGASAARPWTVGDEIEIEAGFLTELGQGHRHLARTQMERGGGEGAASAGREEHVLYRGHDRFVLRAGAGERSEAPDPDPATRGRAAHPPTRIGLGVAWAFTKLGVEHILTGLDHLVFLLALVLLRARLREIAAIVTAFTVAHSATLALAVMGLATPSARIVEPAIALSIVYVGVENLLVARSRNRWRITFLFGLVHGFGFAGALRELSLPRATLPGALLFFNVGVEVGQLCVLAALLPLVALARRRPRFETVGVRVLNGAVVAAGGIWFFARVVGG